MDGRELKEERFKHKRLNRKGAGDLGRSLGTPSRGLLRRSLKRKDLSTKDTERQAI
jgi:hypothetical protein